MSKFIIRVDDVCPTMHWDRFKTFSEALIKTKTPCLIGVIPDCRDKTLFHSPPQENFWDAIRNLAQSGWTIAQHGYTHVCDREGKDWLGLTKFNEFAGHDLNTQLDRLTSGAAILERENVATDVFMAPRHSFDDVTIRALREAGFNAVTDGVGLWPYQQNGLTFIPQLFARPFHLGVGVYTLCCHLDQMKELAFSQLMAFIKNNHDRILSFDQARMLVKDGPIFNAANSALKKMQFYRLKRRITAH